MKLYVLGLMTLGLFFLSSCSKSAEVKYKKQVFEKISNEFNYQPVYAIKEIKQVKQTNDCDIYNFLIETTYPGLGDTFEFAGEIFRPRYSKEKVPVALLFPPVGGKNMYDDRMAKTFCSREIAVFLPTEDLTGIDQKEIPPVEDHDHALRRVIAVSKVFIELSVEDQQIDGEKIGIFGASLGGIVGSFSMGLLPSISAGFFLVAGGDVPYILAHSTQRKVAWIKSRRKAKYGFPSDKAYEAWLNSHMDFDPLDVAVNIPTESVKLVISKNDGSVPSNTQWNLHKALGEPDYFLSRDNHVNTIMSYLGSKKNRNGVADFFLQRFESENPRVFRSARP